MASKSFTTSATGAIAARVDASCGTTNTSPVVTDAAITLGDVGKPVSGTGIPAGATIIGVVPGVSFTMSANATATGTVSVTVASTSDAGAGKTYRQFTLRAQSAANDSVVALETSPDGTTWTEQARVTGGPFGAWCYAGSNHTRRYARANVISLGTGTPPAAAVISYY
jgi:hypothetical protein